MFLTIDDYRPVCSIRELDILQQKDDTIRLQAERTAMEEAAGYLRGRYDTDAAFALEGDERNAMLVQVCVSLSLWYLIQWMPGKMASTNRENTHEQAISWLRDVQAGKSSPLLSAYGNNSSGTKVSFACGYNPRQSYEW